MDSAQKDSIMRMARGAFEERVDYEMSRVIDNITDPNTKATAKRKITLTIELIPDDKTSCNFPLHHKQRQRGNGCGRTGAADSRTDWSGWQPAGQSQAIKTFTHSK